MKMVFKLTILILNDFTLRDTPKGIIESYLLLPKSKILTQRAFGILGIFYECFYDFYWFLLKRIIKPRSITNYSLIKIIT